PSAASSRSLPQAASPPSAGGLQPPSRSLVDPHFQQKKWESDICLAIPPEIALLRPWAASSRSPPQAASPPSAGGLRPPSRRPGLMLNLDTSDICDVVRGGHLECVRWLLAGDCQPYISTSVDRLNTRTILRTAIILGDLDVCCFIKQSFQGHFTKGTSYSLRKVATRNGHPEIERWLQKTVIA
ncbi:hypothetical protein QOT17_007282, partial [Balamuthia mandrillaris]